MEYLNGTVQEREGEPTGRETQNVDKAPDPESSRHGFESRAGSGHYARNVVWYGAVGSGEVR